MPIEIGLWKMGAQLEPVRFQPLENEKNSKKRSRRIYRSLAKDCC